MEFTQNISGNGKGTQIGRMRDYFEGKSITVGLSADDTERILLAIEQLRQADRDELEAYLRQIKQASSDEERKSLAGKTAEFIRQRGWGIFDSLVAGGILMLAKT
jgi:signal recognition particle GTPase